MGKKCFFCDIQKTNDNKLIINNKDFFCRYDDFPVNPGHCEIISKKHIVSFFDLSPYQVSSLYDLIVKTKIILDKKFNPDGYNIGINEGEAAGRTQHHLHIHIIPRYRGDAENPRGGVRKIIAEKADYYNQMKKMPSRIQYM